MKKKGFTLVELLATIAILAVLISLSLVIYNRVKENVLNQELANTISYIETQAKNYANDTNITVVSVEDLILAGYVEPDDETDIYNPVTNESLNCYLIRSTYEDGKYKSVLDIEESNRSEDGKCKEYEKESNLLIGVSTDGINYEIADNSKWYKDNVTLAGLQNNEVLEDREKEYEWKSNLGTTKTTAKITTEAVVGVASKIPYTLTINWKEEDQLIKAEASATINIDKESPIIERIEVPNSSEWSKEKSISIEATDGNGSGLKGIYVNLSTDLEECINEYKICNEELEKCIEKIKSCSTNGAYKEITDETKIEFTEIKTEGTYQAVAIDNVGNISEISDDFELKNVDGAAPELTIIGNPDNETITKSVILTGKAIDSGVGIKKVGFFDKDNPSDNESGWQVLSTPTSEISINTNSITTNTTKYFCAIDDLGNKGCISYEIINIDNLNPIIEEFKNINFGYSKNKTTLSFMIKDNEEIKNGKLINAAAGLKRYAITNSVNPPANNSNEWIYVSSTNKYNYSGTKEINNNATYYLHVEDLVGNKSYKTLNINTIMTLKSVSTRLYKETIYNDSDITQYVPINGIIEYDHAVITKGNGSVNGYLSGNGAYITAKNGTKYTSQRLTTLTESSQSYYAHQNEYCRNYYCSNGGNLRGTMCTDNNYNFSGYALWRCNNGYWEGYYETDQDCKEHFTKSYYCDAKPSGSCSSGQTYTRNCSATCYWQGDYPATCSSTGINYYCNSGDYLSGSICHTCSRGTLINYNTCQYQTYVDYTYYEYYVTIYYYAV